MNILFLESFYGGSHKNFADGLIENSKHNITLMTLPARHWKWRIRGSALHFLENINSNDYDLIFTTDFISVSEVKAGLGPGCPPVCLYFHESQLVYPVQNEKEVDFQYAFNDIMNARHADSSAFNSHFHKNLFIKNSKALFKRLPGPLPAGLPDKIDNESRVLYPGIHKISDNRKNQSRLPLLCWNHRWEYDKNPEDLLSLLKKLKDKNFPFKLAVMGERYKKIPAVFHEIEKLFSDEIIQFGYINSKKDYEELVSRTDFVISTSIQENFGISIMEAVASGAYPILPDRLSYPELIPEYLHNDCIYKNTESGADLIISQWKTKKDMSHLKKHAASFVWKENIKIYDDWFIETVKAERSPEFT